MFSKVAEFPHFFVVFVGSEEEEVVVWQDLGVVLVFIYPIHLQNAQFPWVQHEVYGFPTLLIGWQLLTLSLIHISTWCSKPGTWELFQNRCQRWLTIPLWGCFSDFLSGQLYTFFLLWKCIEIWNWKYDVVRPPSHSNITWCCPVGFLKTV